jgi:hypothetical protein
MADGVASGKAANMFLHWLCGYLLPVCLVVPSFSLHMPAEETPIPVFYDLNVTIDPALGKIAVRGKIEVPLRDTRSNAIQFALHETFAIKQLSVNGQRATFSFQSAEPNPINPATKKVLVRLPFDSLPDKLRLGIEYEGRLKDLPEFGTFPNQKQALDDQINSRLVELANYSSWYPQFFVMGYPIAIDLELSLPQGWIAICSGKKLDDRVKDGTGDHSVVLPERHRHLDCGFYQLQTEVGPPVRCCH